MAPSSKALAPDGNVTRAPRGHSSFLNYWKIGARLHTIEWIGLMLSPLIWLYSASSSPPVREYFVFNGIVMCCFFLFVVQIPAFFTERMAYVDIGWPLGLVISACNCYAFGQGYWLRKVLVCGALGLHGLRMGSNALYFFYPYRFKRDLPRYEYSKVRWQREGMPVEHWWYKIQHDTLQQCFANACFLPAPVLVAAMNGTPTLHLVEILGLGIWAVSWICECSADAAKKRFRRRCKKEGNMTDVLGYKPWDGPEFTLWTLCRHPNYFFEFMCWVGLTLTGACSITSIGLSWELQVGFALMHLGVIRFIYDCLNYWTGAEPAEHFSVLKRPFYKIYQKSTRCFFPLEVPFFDHHRNPGWPNTTNVD